MSGDQGKAGDAFGTIADGAAWVLMGRVLKLGLMFGIQVFLARFLGATGYGSVTVAMLVVAVGSMIGDAGMSAGLTRNVAYYRDEKEKMRGVLRAGFGTSLLLSVFVGVCLYLLAPFLAIDVFGTPELELLFKIGSVGIPFTTLMDISIGATRGVNNTSTHVIVRQTINPIIRVVLVAGLVFAGFGTVGAMTGNILTNVLLGLIAAVLAYRIIGISIRGKSTPMFREMILFSAPLMFSQNMEFLIEKSDTFLIGVFAAPASVGIYNAMFQLRQMGMLFFYPAVFLVQPALTRLTKEDAYDDAKRTYQSVSKWMSFLTAPIFFITVLFPAPIIQLTFGTEYVGAALVLQLLLVSVFVTNIFGANGESLVALGHSKENMYVNGFVAGLNVVLNVLWIPQFGILGAAAASTIAFVTRDVVYTIILYRWYDIHPFSRSMLLPLLGLGGVSAGCFIVVTAVLGQSLESMVVVCVLLGLMYVPIIVVLGGIEPIDALLVERIEKKTGIRLKRLRAVVRHLRRVSI